MSEINIDDLPLPEEPIPEEHFWGEWRDSFTVAPSPPPPGAFIKTPQPAHYDPGHPRSLCQSLAEEAECGLTGLCLRRYTSSLADLVQEGTELDTAKVLEGVAAGVKHLHSLGLIRNDLNPCDIMFEDDRVPVLVDFDSCGRVGEPMGSKGGTPG
ncbi:hypothetical protein DENSPDRAFT_929464 [Dentipellis sp. KUC8613]|nr:hypothetical protein DENSPDRAFT_929464 [Dentipellis sp. KUC8613]